MPALQTGTYIPRTEKAVYHWQKPDFQGTGPEIWVPQYDEQQRQVGRQRLTDEQGRVIKTYDPPKGFENRPSFDGTANYVLIDEHGAVVRSGPNDEAVNIKPGQTRVVEADGTTYTLDDEYSQYVFSQSHDLAKE